MVVQALELAERGLGSHGAAAAARRYLRHKIEAEARSDHRLEPKTLRTIAGRAACAPSTLSRGQRPAAMRNHQGLVRWFSQGRAPHPRVKLPGTILAPEYIDVASIPIVRADRAAIALAASGCPSPIFCVAGPAGWHALWRCQPVHPDMILLRQPYPS